MKDKLLKIINEIKEKRGENKITELNDSMHLNKDLGLDSFDLAEFDKNGQQRLFQSYDFSRF